MRDTDYAKELAYADLGGKRIERIFIKRTLRQAIRLSAWRGNVLRSCPLVVSENELLILMGDAIATGVFSNAFLDAFQQLWHARSSRMALMDEPPHVKHAYITHDVSGAELKTVTVLVTDLILDATAKGYDKAAFDQLAAAALKYAKDRDVIVRIIN